MAKACLHAFFKLLRISPNVAPGMVAPFRREPTSPNSFLGAPYLSLTRPEWETMYPKTAVSLSAIRVSQQDWAGLIVCILSAKVGASWDWDSSANGLTWVYVVVSILSEGLSSSDYHRLDVYNRCKKNCVDITFSLSCRDTERRGRPR